MLDIAIGESFGNCPQYIQLRRPVAIEARPGFTPPSALDPAAETLLAGADMLFVASSGGTAGGVDMSHHGDRPGFLRYGDGRLLVPDCPRRPLLQHAGNFMEDPRAAVVLPDVTTAALPHLAGSVELLWDAMALVERA